MIKGKILLAPGHRIQYEPSQGRHVLLYPEGLVELGETAEAILTRCRAETTMAKLVEDLSEEYETTEEVATLAMAADVKDFLEEAHARGWINITG